jgi:hypothetical protein
MFLNYVFLFLFIFTDNFFFSLNKYSPDGLVSEEAATFCVGCPIGSFYKKVGSQAPTRVPCRSCPTGWKGESVNDTLTCVMCDEGQYQNYTRQPFCLPCIPGKFADEKKQRKCKKCPAMEYSTDAGSKECKTCDLGKFSRGNNPRCLSCEAGMYGDVVGKACQNCTVGRYRTSTMSSNFCENCTIGRYLSEIGQTSCLPCIPGLFMDITGATKCKNCGKNEKSILPGAKKCERCGDGEKSVEGSATCQECDAGEAGTGINGACEACAAGQFRSSNMSARTCENCTIGRYQPETGQASCLPCIPGSFMDITGATECKKCNENFKSEEPGSTECLACGIGKRSRNGSAVCQDCQPGEAGTPCSKCDPGRYRGEEDNSTSCLICEIGQSSTKGSTKCSKCDLGTYGFSPGVCTTCIDKIQYQNSKGATTCLSCKKGDEWTSLTTECTKCDLGMYGFSPGVCKTCIDKKEYQDTKGQTKCLSCTLGEEWTSLISKCTQCTVGRYGSENGTCVYCNAGRFQDEPGKHECKDCSVDTYLSEEGKSSKAECKDCDSDKSTGTSIGNINSAACLCKREEYYQDDKDECSSCPNGGDCSASDGLPSINITAQNGYWKASQDSIKFSDCSKGYQGLNADLLSKQRCNISNSNMNHTDDTEWSSDNQCQATYRGTLCLECIENYVRVGDNCTECQGGASLGMAFMAGAGMIVPVFIGVMASLLCEGKTNKAASDGTKIVGQMKILLTFIQILSSMKTTYNGIPWRKSSYRTYFFLHCYRDTNTVDINSY